MGGARTRASRAALIGAVALLSLLGVTPARADRSRIVEIAVVGEVGDEARLLDATLRELLGRLGVLVVQRGTTSVSRVLARATVDLSDHSEATITVESGRDGHVIVKRHAPRNVTPSILREQIAHEVQNAVDAELSLPEAADTGPAAPPPAPAPSASDEPKPETSPLAIAPPPPPVEHAADAPRDKVEASPKSTSTLALDVTTFAGGGLFSRSQAAARVGAGAILASRRGLKPSLALTGAFVLPFETEGEDVGSRTGVVMMRAMPGIQVLATHGVAVDVAVGGGVDLLVVKPRSDSLPVSALGETTTTVDPVLSTAATMHVAIVPGVVLDLAAALDMAPVGHSYVFSEVEPTGPQQMEVLAPYRLRPALIAGISFTALGMRRFVDQEAAR